MPALVGWSRAALFGAGALCLALQRLAVALAFGTGGARLLDLLLEPLFSAAVYLLSLPPALPRLLGAGRGSQARRLARQPPRW